jgi:hypothetical protein
MPSLSIGTNLHHDNHDIPTSYTSLQQQQQQLQLQQHQQQQQLQLQSQQSNKFVSPHFAAAVSAAAAQALSSSHKSAFAPTSHQLSLYR